MRGIIIYQMGQKTELKPEKFDFVLAANTYSQPFAKRVAHYLDHHTDRPHFKLDNIDAKTYPDGARFTKIGGSVRGNYVFVVHNYLIGKPDQNNYDLLLVADALKRANVDQFTLCHTYVNSRGDKMDEGRVPIPAKLYATLLEAAGGRNFHHFITSHLHASQIQGFFEVGVDNLPSWPLFGWYIKRKLFREFFDKGTQAENLELVAPDAGSYKWMDEVLSPYLRIGCTLRSKKRQKFTEQAGDARAGTLQAGGSIRGKHVLIFDDILCTAGTMIDASNDLVEVYGAKSVWFFPTHLVASPKEKIGQPTAAEEKIAQARSRPHVVTTDTIYRDDNYINANSSWLHCVLSMAPIFGEAILRQYRAMSLSSIYSSPEILEGILDRAFAEGNFKYYNRENGS